MSQSSDQDSHRATKRRMQSEHGSTATTAGPQGESDEERHRGEQPAMGDAADSPACVSHAEKPLQRLHNDSEINRSCVDTPSQACAFASEATRQLYR